MLPDNRDKLRLPKDLPLWTMSPEVPPSHFPLRMRLMWTTHDWPTRGPEATRRRISSTDLVRGELIDRYATQKYDILKQVKKIHRAHMHGNEHVLLYPQQAARILAMEQQGRRPVTRIGGVIRNNLQLDTNIGLAGMRVLCVSYEHTNFIMNILAQKAEALFPKDKPNPEVNEENVHFYLSAFQFLLALTHPFFEGNGRTSEDLMYILWKRRPDLKHTVRFVSPDGRRTGTSVDERGKYINTGASILLNRIATRFLHTEESPESRIIVYSDLLKATKAQGKDPEEAEKEYLKYFAGLLGTMIYSLDNPAVHDPETVLGKITTRLAENLRAASPIYHLQNGRTIP